MLKHFTPVLLLLALVSCRTLKIERPPESYNEPVFSTQYSDLNIPVEVRVETIEKMINRQLPGVLYNDNSFENNDHDNLMLRAWKKDNIRIQVEGNVIYYQVPIEVWIKKRISLGMFGSDTREVSGAIFLKYKTRIAINKDWTLSFTTLPDGYQWIRTPQIKIGPVDIPLPYISDILLNANQSIITKGIDNALKSSFDLRTNVQDIWNKIQEPINISDDPQLWVKVTPDGISTIPLQGSSGKIRQVIGVKAAIRLFWGDEPSDSVNSQLPDLKITSRLDDSFILNGMIGVPMNKANEIVKKELKGYRMVQGRYAITVQDISLFGSGDNLIIAVNTSGDLNGTVYLSGKPYYEADSKSIKVQDLDFDIRTKNVLIRSASWIFHHGLINSIQSKMELPVGDQLEQTRNQVSSYLENNGKLEMFQISGSVNDLSISNIQITRSAINAVFRLKGKIMVKVE
ncbi:MAG: DUF4403 family protein [Bacteroidota bacterium]|nr:DUF4403 family protein [Bacteroidota bacterium]